MNAKRLAVISDVHGSAPALRAVLAEIEESDAELLVSLGDVTWGAQPEETRMLLQSLGRPVILVNGNGERALRELRAGRDGNQRELWMRDHHSDDTFAFLETFVDSAVVAVDGLGAVRFCHGSPRSDSAAEVTKYAEGLEFRE
jgi:predicted phosphodiesterase